MKRTCLYLVLALPLLCAALPGHAQYIATSIADIHNGVHAVNATLEITGVVTAVGAGNHVYIQDAEAIRSGIRCYGGSKVTGISIGDNVTCQGKYIEYYGETELDFAAEGSITVNSTGNAVYNPLTITGANLPYDTPIDTNPAEDYEGVLVKIFNVTMTLDASGTNRYGMWDGTDDGGTTTVRFDDDYFTPLSGAFTLGETYIVTGIARYGHDDYKIVPRTAADIIPLSGDAIAPDLTRATFVDLTTVQAAFSEVMGATGLTTVSNYSIDGGIGNPSLVTVDSGGDSVTLTVPTLSLNQTYTLTVNNIVDLAGNVIAATGNTATFSTMVPQVTINEIMYDSRTAGNLDVEWVELHNTTISPIDISGWTLTDGEGDLVLPAGTIIPATGYLVVSATDAVGIPSAVVVVNPSFVLNNSGDGVALFDASMALIDGSTEILFPDLAGSNAGDSIEKINENFPYTGAASAWRAAVVPALTNPAEYRFASPGRMNNTTPSLTGLNHWVDYR